MLLVSMRHGYPVYFAGPRAKLRLPNLTQGKIGRGLVEEEEKEEEKKKKKRGGGGGHEGEWAEKLEIRTGKATPAAGEACTAIF